MNTWVLKHFPTWKGYTEVYMEICLESILPFYFFLSCFPEHPWSTHLHRGGHDRLWCHSFKNVSMCLAISLSSVNSYCFQIIEELVGSISYGELEGFLYVKHTVVHSIYCYRTLCIIYIVWTDVGVITSKIKDYLEVTSYTQPSQMWESVTDSWIDKSRCTQNSGLLYVFEGR